MITTWKRIPGQTVGSNFGTELSHLDLTPGQ